MLAPGQLFGPFVRGKLGALENVGFQGAGQWGKHPVVGGLLLMTYFTEGGCRFWGRWVWLLKAKELKGILQPASSGGSGAA